MDKLVPVASILGCVYSALMQINLIAIGTRMPYWVKQGYEEYAKRMPKECELVLKEIAPGKRQKNADVARLIRDEGERMIAAIPSKSHVVTLDLQGKTWSTSDLAERLLKWLDSGQNISLLIGGPEGLAKEAINLADDSWQLSNLTFPHPLVRIIVAEQLYRAWSILRNHPYHR